MHPLGFRSVQVALLLHLFSTVILAATREPVLTRIPDGGLQPQALVDRSGTTHLVYFAGDPKAGNLFYVRRAKGESNFSKPLKVNSNQNDAIAVGTIRGPQIALGKNDRLHAAWNGSGSAKTHPGSPMWYTRLNNAGDAFEPEQDLMTFSAGLDGGGSVAADTNGNVFVFWHGQPRADGVEKDRAVFLARSTDEGRTFGAERQINPEPTGACGCCGLKAFSSSGGSLYVLYREARDGTDRNQSLLVSTDSGKTFQRLLTHPWKATTCPMSSAWLADNDPNHVFAAWETGARVWFQRLGKDSLPRALDDEPVPGAGQKFPATATNNAGDTLIVWVEGAGWQKSGLLRWKMLDANGKTTLAATDRKLLPVWSFAAPIARQDGSFEILY